MSRRVTPPVRGDFFVIHAAFLPLLTSFLLKTHKIYITALRLADSNNL